MELLAVDMDGAALGGDAWHRELPKQMRMKIPASRPAVISPETHRHLDEYRRFRHRVRNIYAVNLNASQLEGLVSQLPVAWGLLKSELLAFAELLDPAGAGR